VLGRHAKAAALVVAVLVLVVEGIFVYRWYDRDRAPDAAAGDAPRGSVPASGETMPEGTTPEGTTAAGDVPSDDDDGASFVHTATDANSRGDYTYISHPRIDGDPNAVVLASPAGPYERNIGVWYEPERQRWAIFNQDLAAVPAGSAFGVVVPPADEGFVHRAELLNTVANATYIDDPLLDSKPNAEVSVTQNWNPGGGNGVYNDHPVGVRFDEDEGEWFVHNEDDARMPEGAAFNVAASGAAGPAR
jgi:hypothetical protein